MFIIDNSKENSQIDNSQVSARRPVTSPTFTPKPTHTPVTSPVKPPKPPKNA